MATKAARVPEGAPFADLRIHPRVAALLGDQGITSLYPPQEEAWLTLRDGRNVVVAIPTASGKSLIAYLAILHSWLRTGRKSMLIVPLRALASEKYEELQAFKPLGLSVGIATGDLDEGQDKRLGRHDVIVCTSEKADSLLRHRVGWVEELGCVVADEVHLLHDPGRGPTLEVILSRFHALYPDTQLVGLSATIQNADAIARWLDADLVTSEWRPVELHIGTYFGDDLEFVGQAARELPAGGDPVASLVAETIDQGGQCLVFVSTRRSAEAQAQKLAGLVRDKLPAEAKAALEGAATELDEPGEDSPTAKKLQKLVQAGVSYHTAGLDSRQRRFVEQAFRAGRLKVICATPTLAAGVNTPARRVIIRDMTRFEVGVGARPLPVMEVKQMMGRAGRPRYDPYGEAVLLCKNWEQKEAAVAEYLHGEPEPVTSKLAADAALRIHVLASVAGGYCATMQELADFLGHTFWAQETDDWIIHDRLGDVAWFLIDNGFLEEENTPDDGGQARANVRLKPTLFGQRASDLYIDPFSALRMRHAFGAKAAPTPFGLLEVVAGCPDLYPLYLRQSDGWVEEVLAEHEKDILLEEDRHDHEGLLSYTKTAALLSEWINEKHLQDLEQKYQIGPGDIRMRVDNAKWMVHAFRELARAMHPDWARPLTDLGMRLEHGIREELLQLVRLKGIGRIRARTLFRAGVKRMADLKAMPLATLADLPGFGPKVAQDLLRQVGVDVPESDGAGRTGPASGSTRARAKTQRPASGDPAPDRKGSSASTAQKKPAAKKPGKGKKGARGARAGGGAAAATGSSRDAAAKEGAQGAGDGGEEHAGSGPEGREAQDGSGADDDGPRPEGRKQRAKKRDAGATDQPTLHAFEEGP